VGQPAAGEPALDVRGVARRFARRWVLRGLDLRVHVGQIVALTGRNGSGKTTLLRICATALRPTRGGGAVFGSDLLRDPDAVRAHVGLLAHNAGLYDDLTATENLAFGLRMAGLRPDPAAIGGALSRVGLDGEADERVRGFSAGMRRRLALARLLVRPPRLLLLDEPYASFDSDGITLVNEFSREIAEQGGAVLLATHDLARGRGVFDRRVHVEQGRAEERDPAAADALDGPGSDA
jgi:heme exporter protein A